MVGLPGIHIISILAPARGATPYSRIVIRILFEFQSSLPRGERHKRVHSDKRQYKYFNPRSREGSDEWAGIQTVGQCISILAPARGATTDMQAEPRLSYNFNPRSREGSDKDAVQAAVKESLFQSSLPRGERHSNGYLASRLIDFNPRSREGSDRSSFFLLSLRYPISILAPARGATTVITATASTYSFQSSLPRGERRCGRYSVCQCIGHFNPRSREGSDFCLPYNRRI